MREGREAAAPFVGPAGRVGGGREGWMDDTTGRQNDTKRIRKFEKEKKGGKLTGREKERSVGRLGGRGRSSEEAVSSYAFQMP